MITNIPDQNPPPPPFGPISKILEGGGFGIGGAFGQFLHKYWPKCMLLVSYMSKKKFSLRENFFLEGGGFDIGGGFGPEY